MKHIVMPKKGWTRGFALVVALSMMILLTIIAVGLLSLASISLRTVSEDQAMATARANARMALMHAIGELQRTAGPDTRVTARADILDENHPPVLGVWKSWEGTNHETSGNFAGRPIRPDYSLKNPDSTSTNKRFLAWLTSANAEDPTELPDTIASSNSVTLLGEGSVGSDPNLQIHLPPTLVESNQQPGAIAWWVGGENQKAYIPKPERQETNLALRRKQAVSKAKSSNVFDPQPFDLESVLADPDRGRTNALVNKAISLNQVDFLEPNQSGVPVPSRRSTLHFHDLSTTSVGLLTNTATGGWRKDMSLLSERWSSNAFPKDNLPFFRLNPDAEHTVSSFAEEGNFRKARSLFYPWAAYTTFGFPEGANQHPVASWNSLMNFASFYKTYQAAEQSGPNSIPTINSWACLRFGITDPDRYRHLHTMHAYPIVARVQWVFSHFSEEAGADPSAPGSFLYNPKLLITPVITLWNPYNVKLRHNNNMYFDFKLMPVALSYQMQPTENTRYNSIINVDEQTRPIAPMDVEMDDAPFIVRIQCSIPSSGTIFNPGQTIVYSPAAGNRMVVKSHVDPPGNSNQIPLEKGFRFTGGHLYPVKHGTTVMPPVAATTPMKVRARFDTEYRIARPDWFGANGVGVAMQVGHHPDPHQLQVMRPMSRYTPALADLLYPRLTEDDLNAPTVEEVELLPQPFLSAIWGLRFTTKTNNQLVPQYNVSGLAQSTPFGNWITLYHSDPDFAYRYSGTGHPHTSRFTYSFLAYSSGGGADYPGSGLDPDFNGYIITGEQSDRGLPRAIVAERPARPLASLAELTHWDLRFDNPAPPFAFNVIGNSDASPMLPFNAVFNAADAAAQGGQNFRHDDFYCANHLLFDDWFFSSMTPDPATFGGLAYNQERVYGRFMTDEARLANSAYRPILEDQLRINSGVPSATLFSEHVNTNESWQTIASRLEVEGMFNVNSTSVTAWRALLGHARGQRVLHITPTGTYTGDTVVRNHPVSRSTIAGSAVAGTPVAGAFAEASEFIGYRTLDDAFLDDLAEEVVRQVRLRGPFLSLAEFINRQLSDDPNLALAGALQSALNTLTDGGGSSSNPLAGIMDHDVTTRTSATVPQINNPANEIGYVTPAAANGYSSYGLPGWTRQADILRPIAPFLSARDDTFTVRAYGDARDASGNVIAKAVCEAVVRRTRDFVDSADAADTTVTLTSDDNKAFGRRFEVVSFRWLNTDEV